MVYSHMSVANSIAWVVCCLVGLVTASVAQRQGGPSLLLTLSVTSCSSYRQLFLLPSLAKPSIEYYLCADLGFGVVLAALDSSKHEVLKLVVYFIS